MSDFKTYDELKLLGEGKAPDYQRILDFLKQMADKFEEQPKLFAEKKGMKIQTEKALLTQGNTSLMVEDKKES